MRTALQRIMVAVLCLSPVPAAAQLSCEQLVASAQAGIKLRDQGASLGQVLAETGKGELRERFSPEELALIRRALQLTFTGEVSLHELAETCAAGQGGARR
ncbi:MAG: hypothetical protein KF834_13535 [Burkholderiales bacterium]|nr:hypothetical protein [Burkholderiales bacterium]